MAGVNRFTFVQRQGANVGRPPIYDVVDSGNSQVVGQIQFDVIMLRWSFVLDEPQYCNIVPSSADGTQISNFIGGLVIPTWSPVS